MSQQGIDATRNIASGLMAKQQARTQFDPLSRNPALQVAVPSLARSGRESMRDNAFAE
jgi:hypothetical protein